MRLVARRARRARLQFNADNAVTKLAEAVAPLGRTSGRSSSRRPARCSRASPSSPGCRVDPEDPEGVDRLVAALGPASIPRAVLRTPPTRRGSRPATSTT